MNACMLAGGVRIAVGVRTGGANCTKELQLACQQVLRSCALFAVLMRQQFARAGCTCMNHAPGLLPTRVWGRV